MGVVVLLYKTRPQASHRNENVCVLLHVDSKPLGETGVLKASMTLYAEHKMHLNITDTSGRTRELSDIGYIGRRTLSWAMLPWVLFATQGMRHMGLDIDGATYFCFYVLPGAVLAYNLTVHARSRVLSLLNHHIGLVTLHGVFTSTDPRRIILTHSLLCLTLITRFMHRGCVFRMMTDNRTQQDSVRFNNKNLQIFLAVIALGYKLAYLSGMLTTY